MELLVHINKRIKSRPLVQLPVEALLLQYQDPAASSFVTVSGCVKWRYTRCVQKVPDLSINNIFLYLELTEYCPLQNSLLAQQCTSSTAFSTFGSSVRRVFVPSSHSSC
jgi:hypothetical protein